MRHVALVLASLLALFAAYALGASSAASPAVSSAQRSDDERGLVLLAQIAADVRVLREHAKSAPALAPPPQSAREAATTSTIDAAAVLETLAELLSNASTRVDGVGSRAGRVGGSGWGSLGELTRASASLGDGADFAQFNARLRREHALWTIDDVVDRYGPPSRVVAADGSLLITYETLPDEDPSDDGPSVDFTVVQGRVTWARFSR